MECSSCGNNMVFSPEKNCLICQHCENKINIKTEQAEQKKWLTNSIEKIKIETKIINCKSCGAESAFDGKLLSNNCSYCGSPVIDTTIKGILRPDNIMPFEITKNKAKENIKLWISKLWFAPNALKNIIKNSGINEIKGKKQ